MICSVARVGGGPLVPGGSMPPSAGRSAAAGRSHHSQALELTIPMATEEASLAASARRLLGAKGVAGTQHR